MNLDLTKKYTYDDYYSWGDDVPRCELIDGIVYMASAPLGVHQKISGDLFGIIWNHLRKRKCEVYHAPFDVRLDADKGNETTVQPDIVVICDPNKIDKRGCKGAPDLVVEITSKSTRKRDMVLKYEKYREAGVLEYWIVHPDIKSIQVHTFADGIGNLQNYIDDMEVKSNVLQELVVTANDIFPAELEEETDDDLD